MYSNFRTSQNTVPVNGWGLQSQTRIQKPSDEFTMQGAGDYNENDVNIQMAKGLIDDPSHMSKSFELPPGIMNMFPMVFLMFSIAMFVMPAYLCWYVGESPTVKHFFFHFTRFILILPVVYIVTFVVHMCKRNPSRIFVTLSLSGSCLGLLILSNTILMDAYTLSPMLAAASDCSWGPKRELEGEWQLARAYYATCTDKMAKNQSITFAAAVNDYRIQDCPNYVKDSELHPSWAYLAHLEETEWCGGWCKSAPPIWTKGHVQDSCSSAAAQIINDKVMWCLKQVCFYSVFALLVTSALLLCIPRVLRDYGIDWYSPAFA